MINLEHKQPKFLAMNPQHTVPTLDDNGRYLWESHAIIPYLIGKYAKTDDDHPLYPKDLYIRARIDQRMHFETGILFRSLLTLLRPIVYEGAIEITDAHLKVVHEALETVETFLAVDLYMVGDQLTVADFSVITTLTHLVSRVPLDADKYPKTAAYIKRLEALPYFDEINTKNLATFTPLINFILARNKAAVQAANAENQ